VETADTQQLEIQCDDCGATVTLPAHRFATLCPYCASPSVVDRPAQQDGARRARPDFILGFVIDRAEAERRVRAWIGRSRWFAPSDLKRAEVRSVEGIYLPTWLYGSTAHSTYHASIGEQYTVTETYTTTDSKGNTVVRTRTVVKTEWRELSGTHASYVLDVLVTASRGLDNAKLESVEPFDLRGLRRYDPAVVSGWIAEEATLSRQEGHDLARAEAMQFIEGRIRDFLPGDTSQLKQFETQFSAEDTDLVLLPIWVFAARYGPEQKSLRILINGQTGEIQGEVPKSPLKIAAGVLGGLALLALLVLSFMLIMGVLL
jgi:hypothetical protein